MDASVTRRYRRPTDADIAAALRRGLGVKQVRREVGGSLERIRTVRDGEAVAVRTRGPTGRTIDADALAAELRGKPRGWRQVAREWGIGYPRLRAVAAAHGLSPAPRGGRPGEVRPRAPGREGWDSSRYPHRPDGMSQEEVATALGVSIQRVQQIEAAALAKLRRMVA